MGVYSGAIGVTQYQISGAHKPGALEDLKFDLQSNSFRGFENQTDEISLGWVELDDYSESSFDQIERDHLIAFTFRKDTRKIPGSVMKMNVRQKEREFLQQNPTLTRVPKKEKAEIKEAILAELLPRVLPSAATIDILWDTRNHVLTAFSTSLGQLEYMTDLFRKTFKDRGFEISLIHPATRARKVMPVEERQELLKMIQGDTVLGQIEGNQWIGSEFLRWIFGRTVGRDNTFAVTQDGPAESGSEFGAYIDEKIILCGNGNEGSQKVSISGPQDRFSEVLDALRHNKHIEEATIFLVQHENQWRLTLKGKTFQFASVKIPTVKVDVAHEQDERDALLFERSETLNQGVQLFDSLLLEYLLKRINQDKWAEELKHLQSLLSEDVA